MLNPFSIVTGTYDKTHLVPFGEYVPLRGLLGHFFDALATGLSSTEYSPGVRPVNHTMPSTVVCGWVLRGIPAVPKIRSAIMTV